MARTNAAHERQRQEFDTAIEGMWERTEEGKVIPMGLLAGGKRRQELEAEARQTQANGAMPQRAFWLSKGDQTVSFAPDPSHADMFVIKRYEGDTLMESLRRYHSSAQAAWKSYKEKGFTMAKDTPKPRAKPTQAPVKPKAPPKATSQPEVPAWAAPVTLVQDEGGMIYKFQSHSTQDVVKITLEDDSMPPQTLEVREWTRDQAKALFDHLRSLPRKFLVVGKEIDLEEFEVPQGKGSASPKGKTRR